MYNFVVRLETVNGVEYNMLQLFSNGVAVEPGAIHAGDRIGVIRRPAYTTQYRQIATGNVPNQAEITRNYDNLYAYRRGGYIVGFSDPVICGPLTPFPFVDSERPLNSGCAILPKRVSNYNLDFEYGPVTVKDKTGESWLFTPNLDSINCSYLQEHTDLHESIRLYAPKVVRQYLETPAPNQKHTFTLRNGPPNYIVILQHNQHSRYTFTFMYRDEDCPVLRNADVFDFYKMNQRAISRRNRSNFVEWIADGSPIVMKFEELGIWGPIQEWPDRFEIEFMVTANTPGDLEILYVYENFALISDHFGVKFTHI
jgi:hypothetical protein